MITNQDKLSAEQEAERQYWEQVEAKARHHETKAVSHTPGPWKVANFWPGGPGLVCEHCQKASTDERPGHFQIIGLGGQYGVASCQFPFADERDRHQAEDNARLIAAAPELLEACGKALTALRTLDAWCKVPVDCMVLRYGINELQSAILKAEGSTL